MTQYSVRWVSTGDSAPLAARGERHQSVDPSLDHALLHDLPSGPVQVRVEIPVQVTFERSVHVSVVRPVEVLVEKPV